MEPEPTFYRSNNPYLPNSHELKSGQEIEEIYNRAQRTRRLFDVLLQEKKQGAGAEQHAMKEEAMVAQNKIIPERRNGCKCSKIGCLKLYCECFANGLSCTEHCSCTCCRNKPGNELEIYNAKMLANYRHPGTFEGIPAYVPIKKCTCKKSQCRKKYCQCYSAGLKCTEFCECRDCHNSAIHDHNFMSQNLNENSAMDIEVHA